ncbi:hypothetical protein H8E52_05060 [bacterium]|nr:hypothetical protein [bacterium]
MTETAKLRVGLMLDSLELEAWQIRMIEEIQQSDYAEISFLIMNGSAPEQPSFAQRFRSGWGTRIFRIYVKSERAFLRALNLGGPDAFETRTARSLFEGVERITAKPERKRFSDHFSDEDLCAISDQKLDVIVRLGFRILKGGILGAARHGVWSFHHGDNQVVRGGAPGFWELFQGRHLTGSVLQVLNEDLDNGLVLCRSWSSTDRLFLTRSMNNYYWKTLSFLPRKLRELHGRGGEAFFRGAESLNRRPEFYSERLFKEPRNGEMIRLWLGHATRYLAFKIRKLFNIEQWVLFFHIGDSPSPSLWRYKAIMPPKDRFWADPFVMERDGRWFIFVEDYRYRDKRGRISVIEVDAKGNWTPARVVLEQPFHLSYPFLFEHGGELYMIPESLADRSIEAYRCVEFPDRWESAGKLMDDVDAVDSTLLKHDGKWWLFTNMVENPGASLMDELYVFSSHDPLSRDWTPHPGNPVLSDVRSSRPAGRFFERDGRLFRPSQDSSRLYGYALTLNQVTALDEERFEEEAWSRIEPNWHPRVMGVHTLNFAGRLTVVDAYYRRSRLRP